MKLIISFVLLLSLLLVGCGKSREAQLVGNWTGPNGSTVDLKEDKTFSMSAGLAIAGKWSLTDSNVKLTIEQIGGKPIAEFKKQMEALAKGNAKAQEAMKSMETVNATVSEDNKTMTATMGPQSVKFTKTEK